MPKPGISIIEETAGTGIVLECDHRVHVVYDIQLNRGDFLTADEHFTFSLSDRSVIAGLRYGVEGMRVGGTRKFKASPHLCYADKEIDKVPKNAVLIVHMKSVQLAKRADD
jgi:FKBP-type peptidyl-prolyl cis-trans isomerase